VRWLKSRDPYYKPASVDDIRTAMEIGGLEKAQIQTILPEDSNYDTLNPVDIHDKIAEVIATF
jgi:hypothetical protein